MIVKKVIQLLDEKTGDVVRTICFRSPKEFDEFIARKQALVI